MLRAAVVAAAPVTLTVTMTNVVTNQPLTTAGASVWANYLISVRPL